MGGISRKEYEALFAPLHAELVEMARWVSETGQRVLVLFEGRDASGKGGAIQAISRILNPRHCRIVALGSPSERERGQWYFQRYVAHLPTKGEIVLFDRSWYNRAGVERVMRYCTEEEVQAFFKAVPEFERHLVEHGILLFKYWLACDQEQQEQRFADRLNNPLKRWKLSPVDQEARTRYEAYTQAREEMLAATHTVDAPWTLVDFNDKQIGRLTLLRDLLDRLPDTRLPYPEIDWPPLPFEPNKERFGVLQPIPSYDIAQAQAEAGSSSARKSA
jgi:polyphosphate kinase 2